MALHGLRKTYPCHDGRAFLRQCRNLQEAWNACDRWDWLLWYLRYALTKKAHAQADRVASYVKRLYGEGNTAAGDVAAANVIKKLYPTPPPLKPRYR